MLVAAQSGRALAAAACRAGFRPLVADLFADADTAVLASDVEKVEGGLRCGLRRGAVIAALERLTSRAPRPPIGVVVGTGFEDRPGHLDALGRRFGLLGTPAAAVRAAKRPETFAAACASLAVPHPRVAAGGPEGGNDPDGRRGDGPAGRPVEGSVDWLVKRRGGAGGGHVRPYEGGAVPTGHYLMARVEGEPMSVAVLADAGGAVCVGWCRQLFAPVPGSPYRFAGLVGPVAAPGRGEAPGQGPAIEAAAVRLARHFGVVGLASLDVVVGRDAWWAIELNPRPGASLDVLDPEGALFAAHVAAARGEGVAPPVRAGTGGVRASLIAYAQARVAAVPPTDWPDWVADRPKAGETIPAGAPIATALAVAETEEDAIALVRSRAAHIETIVGGNRE